MARGKRNNRQPRLQRMWGHVLYLIETVATGSSQRVISVHPRVFQDPRAILYADMFEGFKFVSLKIEALGLRESGSRTGIMVAFRPMLLLDTTPIDLQEVSVIDRMTLAWPDQTVPCKMTLNKGELAGEKPFYNCSDVNDHCGLLVVSAFDQTTAAAVQAHVAIKLTYVIDFYGPIDPANTMKRLRQVALKDALRAVEEATWERVNGSEGAPSVPPSAAAAIR